MAILNRTTTQARDAQIIVGIKKHLENTPMLPLNATAYTPGSLAAFYQRRIDAANAITTARAAWLYAVSEYNSLNEEGVAVTYDLKHYVMAAFGKTGAEIADFGLTPPKTATQTPEQKAAAVAKRIATRKARNTLGKKAKLKIKGTVTAPVSTPATPVATLST